MAGEPEPELDAVLAETLAFTTVRPEGDGWIGDTPPWFGDYLFGGFVVAQAVHAATRTAPPGRRIHSLHAYFLRPVRAGPPVVYAVTPIRDGRTFASRRLEATQSGEPVLTMTCSFATDTEGYEYELPGTPDLPRPDDDDLETSTGPGPWRAAWIGPTPPDADGTRASTHRIWFTWPEPLPDDPHLHAALLGFATDWTGTGGRPLHLDGDTRGMVSLDHAVWFHRPARVDEWLLYDVHSLVNAGGRGLLRGTMRDTEGRVVASVAQEMLLRPYEPDAT
jgi:acyl-CoA thioesterase II